MVTTATDMTIITRTMIILITPAKITTEMITTATDMTIITRTMIILIRTAILMMMTMMTIMIMITTTTAMTMIMKMMMMMIVLKDAIQVADCPKHTGSQVRGVIVFKSHAARITRTISCATRFLATAEASSGMFVC